MWVGWAVPLRLTHAAAFHWRLDWAGRSKGASLTGLAVGVSVGWRNPALYIAIALQ